MSSGQEADERRGSPAEIVRRVFPDASGKQVESLLWNHTGWPAFWRTGNPERDILHSLRQLKRAMARGKSVCMGCTRDVEHEGDMCGRCSRAWRKA